MRGRWLLAGLLLGLAIAWPLGVGVMLVKDNFGWQVFDKTGMGAMTKCLLFEYDKYQTMGEESYLHRVSRKIEELWK